VSDDLVTVDRPSDGVALVTIDRPERLNALSMPTITALKDTFGTLGADDDTRVIVITGAGRAFCAGLDLKDVGPSPVTDGLSGVAAETRGQVYFGDVVQRIRAAPQPVIAALNGVAVGGGLAIASACEIRVAVRSARFNVQALRMGLSAGETGLSWHLPRLAPAGIPFELLLTSRFFDADEAERIGFVQRVVDDDAPGGAVSAALAIADGLAAHDRDALALAKQIMWTNLTAPSLDAALALEARAWDSTWGATWGTTGAA
jgi:enoyl-CoA hydratase